MGGANLATFVAASLLLIVTPGPDMLFVIARGIAQGRLVAVVTSLGISMGLLVHTMLAALGLSVLLSKSLFAFLLVKYLGAAYLLYLGSRALRDREAIHLQVDQGPVPPATALRQGLLSNLLNPKAALFVQAFLPQFVVRGSGNPAAQILALGLVLIALGLVFHLLVACTAEYVGAWLRRQPHINARLRWLTGSVFIGLGLRLALPERR